MDRNFTVKRTHFRTDGVFGVWDDAGAPIALSIERPWLNNKPDVSCILAGTYICNRIFSHHFGYEVFEITGVAGRTRVEIHPANTMQDLEGCVGIGQEFGWLSNEEAVLSSQAAFKDFMGRLVGVDSFRLTILDFNDETKIA